MEVGHNFPEVGSSPSPTPPPDSPDVADPSDESSNSPPYEVEQVFEAPGPSSQHNEVKDYKIAEILKIPRPSRNPNGSVKLYEGEESYKVIPPKNAQELMSYMRHAIVLPFSDTFIKRNRGFRIYRGKIVLPSGLADTRNILVFPEGFLYDLSIGKNLRIPIQEALEVLAKEHQVRLHVFLEMTLPVRDPDLPALGDETGHLVSTNVPPEEIVETFVVNGHREDTTICYENESEKILWIHCSKDPEPHEEPHEEPQDPNDEGNDNPEIPPRPGRSHAGSQTDVAIPFRRGQNFAARLVLEQPNAIRRRIVPNIDPGGNISTQTSDSVNINSIHVLENQTLCIVGHTVFNFNRDIAACLSYMLFRSGALSERHIAILPPTWPPNFPSDIYPFFDPTNDPTVSGYDYPEDRRAEEYVPKDRGDPTITDWVIQASQAEVHPPEYSPTDSARRRAVPLKIDCLTNCRVIVSRTLEPIPPPEEKLKVELKSPAKMKLKSLIEGETPESVGASPMKRMKKQ